MSDKDKPMPNLDVKTTEMRNYRIQVPKGSTIWDLYTLLGKNIVSGAKAIKSFELHYQFPGK